MNRTLTTTIISTVICVFLTIWIVSHTSLVQAQNSNDVKNKSESVEVTSQLLGVFYSDDYYPKKTSTINGTFWLYDFSTGSREKVIVFPRDDYSISHKLRNNQLLFETGGNLSLLRLPDTKLDRIASDVPKDQFGFSPDGKDVYYLTCKPLLFACKSRGLHRYSISTRQTTDLKKDFQVDTLLGSDATKERLFFAREDSIYAIHHGRVELIYRFVKRKGAWLNFSLSPNGAIVLVSRETRRGGIFEVGILDLARKTFTVLDQKLTQVDGLGFGDDSNSIHGFYSSGINQYTFLTLDLQTLSFSEIPFTSTHGYPMNWQPNQQVFLVRREEFKRESGQPRGRVTFTLEPKRSQQPYSFAIDGEKADGNTPNFGFVGWFKR